MEFFAREKELKKLSEIYNKKDSQLALVYGRRRIGKSELIKKSLENLDMPCFYYECKETNEQNNVQSLCAVIGSVCNFPSPGFDKFEEVLDFLFKKASDAPMVLVLDEYQYLRNVIVGLDSIIQSKVDNYKGKSTLKIILCGSYIDIMSSLLETQNPLYGRVDCTLYLQQMDYYDSALFYPEFSQEDKVALYSVFGGVPYYNNLIDSSISVKENIINLIASQGSRLENEVPLYLKSEISKLSNSNQVLEAVAKGYSKFSDILSQSHISSSPTLVDVLEKLIRIKIIEKKFPINDKDNKKRTQYLISDRLFLFYYKFIFPHLSQLSVMNPEVFFDKYIAEDLYTHYIPKAFEEISKQYLIRININGKNSEPFYKVGSLWYDNAKEHKNGEFDIVTESDDGYIFYEVKFKNEKITDSIIKEEIGQINSLGFKPYKYGFVSKSGFDLSKDFAKDNNLILITLEDLYSSFC